MSDTLKEFLAELDLPAELADKPIAEIKDKFNEQFVARKIADSDPDIVKNITGKTLGRLSRQLGTTFGLEKDEYEGQKFEDIIAKAEAKTKTQIEDLKKAAEGKNPDAKEWEEKLRLAKEEAKQFKGMAKAKEDELNLFKETSENEKKGLKLGFALTGIKSNIEWSESANALAKRGFDDYMKETYDFDFDEKNVLLAKDKAGHPIPNGKNTELMTAEELYKAEAAKHGLLKLSNPNPVKRPGDRSAETQVKTPDGYTRRLPKAAEENASR